MYTFKFIPVKRRKSRPYGGDKDKYLKKSGKYGRLVRRKVKVGKHRDFIRQRNQPVISPDKYQKDLHPQVKNETQQAFSNTSIRNLGEKRCK